MAPKAGGPPGTFTAEDLHRWLALEVTRADSSFVRSQIAARSALSHAYQAGADLLTTPWLEVDALELRLGLVAVVPPWPVRLWRQLRQALGGAGSPAAAAPRFRFAATGDARHCTQLVCRLKRGADGRFEAKSPEDGD
jgi:hypothetical protein